MLRNTESSAVFPALSVAVAKRITANRIQPTLKHWEVVVEYSPRDNDELDRVDDDGNPTDDPLDWRPRIAVGSNIYRQLVEKAYYRGGYAAGFDYTSGDFIPPMNSAGQPFTNPPWSGMPHRTG